jgi:exopolyphosphatase/pppGpp-phosphohydrolase
VTRLRIGRDRTTLGDRALALGWETIALAHFKHEPPSPLELENAITAVEDELARVRPPGGGELQTSDAFIRDIAAVAGIAPAPEMAMTVDAVEQVFERLAMRTPGLPSGRAFAATLLILREVMHHLQFRSIVVATARQA